MTADFRDRRRVSLSAAELDAVLSAANGELLDYVRAAADPDAGLLAIMTAREGVRTPAGSHETTQIARGRSSRAYAWIGRLPVTVAITVIVAISVLIGATASWLAYHAQRSVPSADVGLSDISVRTASPVQETAEFEVGTIFFRQRQAILSTSADAELRRMLPMLLAVKGLDIVVSWYAEIPSATALSLSDERAQVVRKWLILHRIATSAVSVAAHTAVGGFGINGPRRLGNQVTICLYSAAGQWLAVIGDPKPSIVAVTFMPGTAWVLNP